MPVENTDLERRVLAHEQILQALMAQLAEHEPGFLDRMHERFAGARRGAHEHDYVETADYAEDFLREVMRLGRTQEVKIVVTATEVSPVVEAPPATHAAHAVVIQAAMPKATTIRTARVGGVWHVTRDDAFLGDYLAEGPARDAAAKAAQEIAGRGGRAELVFEPPR